MTTTKAPKKRIYIAIPLKTMDAVADPLLVNAGTPSACRLHVTKGLFEIRPATPHEIARHVGNGIKVAEAGVEGQADLPQE